MFSDDMRWNPRTEVLNLVFRSPSSPVVRLEPTRHAGVRGARARDARARDGVLRKLARARSFRQALHDRRALRQWLRVPALDESLRARGGLLGDGRLLRRRRHGGGRRRVRDGQLRRDGRSVGRRGEQRRGRRAGGHGRGHPRRRRFGQRDWTSDCPRLGLDVRRWSRRLRRRLRRHGDGRGELWRVWRVVLGAEWRHAAVHRLGLPFRLRRGALAVRRDLRQPGERREELRRLWERLWRRSERHAHLRDGKVRDDVRRQVHELRERLRESHERSEKLRHLRDLLRRRTSVCFRKVHDPVHGASESLFRRLRRSHERRFALRLLHQRMRDSDPRHRDLHGEPVRHRVRRRLSSVRLVLRRHQRRPEQLRRV